MRLSVVVVGCGLLIVVSFLVPYFDVPFGGALYMQWLSGLTVLLGIMAHRRREAGPLATAAAAVTVGAGVLLLFMFAFPLLYYFAMRFLMSD